MERHTVKSSAESFYIPFSLDNSEAKRICTLNAREEKRLEKVRKNLEKQRIAETKRLLKAQKDITNHLFASRKVVSLHSAGKVNVLHRMNPAWTGTSQELLSSLRSGHLDPQCLIPEKSNSESKGKYSQKVGIDYSNMASVSYSVLPRMRRIMASEGNFIQRCRSWSSRARPNLRFLGNKVSDEKVITKHSNSPAQRSFIHENSTDAVVSETKERSLSEVLPPVILPPLHSQKEKTLKGKRHVAFQMKNEELWDGLEDCRYIRTYIKTADKSLTSVTNTEIDF